MLVVESIGELVVVAVAVVVVVVVVVVVLVVCCSLYPMSPDPVPVSLPLLGPLPVLVSMPARVWTKQSINQTNKLTYQA